jgi:ABC-2 type transport system permease protein
MGLNIASGIGGVLFTICIIILLGMGFSAFSNGLALVFQRQETLIAVINFISLPVMFLSSAFVPPDFLPRWLQIVRQGNPVEYAVIGVRSLVNDGWIWDDIWIVLLALGLWAIVAIVFGTLMFRKRAE